MIQIPDQSPQIKRALDRIKLPRRPRHFAAARHDGARHNGPDQGARFGARGQGFEGAAEGVEEGGFGAMEGRRGEGWGVEYVGCDGCEDGVVGEERGHVCSIEFGRFVFLFLGAFP